MLNDYKINFHSNRFPKLNLVECTSRFQIFSDVLITKNYYLVCTKYMKNFHMF